MGQRRDTTSELTVLRRPPFESGWGFWAIVLLGLVILLTGVAVLQYRWTSDASRADEMRIGAEIDSLMMKWHSEVYGEFSSICTALQVGPDSGARDTWNDYLERYMEWNDALPHEPLPYIYRNPDLVGEIYIWETNQPANPRLFWLNRTSRKIEPLPPPAEFSTLLARLQTNSASLSMALRAWIWLGPSQTAEGKTPSAPFTPGSDTFSGWQFDENVPALVHPIFRRGSERPLSGSSPVDWIIVTIDMNVLQHRVFPELSKRYFGGLDGLDYKVAVVRKGTSAATIYSSDPGFGVGQLNDADSTLNVFGFPPEQTSGGARPTGGYSSSLPSTEWQNLTAAAWFPVIQYGPSTDFWLLELQDRAVPLHLAIERVRRNNLALSALVLILLTLSFGVLMFAGYRAHNFARLQMDFVSSISHELRTPLTAIFSAGENIKDGVIRKQSDLDKYGSIVTAQSRQLMNHVDRILLFASMRSGKDRYTLRPLELSEILLAVRRNLSSLLAEENCVLEETIEAHLPRVMADMFAVCGCLENLITNAIKYGGADRRIFLSAGLHKLSDDRGEITISVKDHGIGIQDSELKRIFVPFYRAPQAIAAQIHGTGLGLSLAKHLAEVLGGRLTVISAPGSGSVFTLHLQLAPDQSHRPSTESTEALIR